MEVWRWVEAGEHQLGGWRYGGGVVEAASDTPTWHGAGGGWWLGGGAGHGPRPSLVWRTSTPPRHWSLLVTAACPGTWSLVCSLLRSGRDLTKHC